MTDHSDFRALVVIRVTDSTADIIDCVKDIAAPELPVLLVDDGCSKEVARKIDACAADVAHVSLVRHASRKGMGACVMTGADFAQGAGYSHIIEIDSTRWYEKGYIEEAVRAASMNHEALLCAYPVHHESNHGGCPPAWDEIMDVLNWMRAYPVKTLLSIISTRSVSKGPLFDGEIYLRFKEAGIPVIDYPVATGFTLFWISVCQILAKWLVITAARARIGLMKLFGR